QCLRQRVLGRPADLGPDLSEGGASGRVASVATTAWTVLAHRKIVAAGVSAGVTAVGVASYAAGRRSGRRTLGPITRFTGGRI
ncbi:hypothetical protein ACWELY_33535, partial [Streptomyces sp. NPDC004599]